MGSRDLRNRYGRMERNEGDGDAMYARKGCVAWRRESLFLLCRLEYVALVEAVRKQECCLLYELSHDFSCGLRWRAGGIPRVD